MVKLIYFIFFPVGASLWKTKNWFRSSACAERMDLVRPRDPADNSFLIKSSSFVKPYSLLSNHSAFSSFSHPSFRYTLFFATLNNSITIQNSPSLLIDKNYPKSNQRTALITISKITGDCTTLISTLMPTTTSNGSNVSCYCITSKF